MAGISINRTDINLPAEVSTEIMQSMKTNSAIMQLAKQIALPGRGVQIPVITSDPIADWVAETGAKPVSAPGLETKMMQAYKLAVIVPFSDEFRRDAASLYDALVARLPGALAAKFDATVMGESAPGENFDQFVDIPGRSLTTDPYQALVSAYADIAGHGGALNGFALSPTAVGALLGATDTTGRPLFLGSASDGTLPRLLGAKVVEGQYIEGGNAEVGVAGDWNHAMYGIVDGVKISVSDQSGLTIGGQQVNLWEHNMFAVRAEIEVGFRADTSKFNLLTYNEGGMS